MPWSSTCIIIAVLFLYFMITLLNVFQTSDFENENYLRVFEQIYKSG